MLLESVSNFGSILAKTSAAAGILFLENKVSAKEATPRRPAWTPDKPTRFEVAALLGKRANMIAAGAEPRVDPGDVIDPVSIARMELDAGVLPLEIVREYPDKTVETIKIGQ